MVQMLQNSTCNNVNQSNIKTAILGAGLSGLTIGYLLRQKGLSFEVLETEQACGGLMRSSKQDGFIFDGAGSHIIFSKNAEALSFILNLLGQNKVENRRNTKILYNNILIKYPFENGLADLPKEENFECLNAFIKNLLKKGQFVNSKNLRDWFFNKFGEGIAKKYLIPYNEKIWKYRLDKMGLNWVERIPSPPIEDIIKSSLGIETEGYEHQLHFYYPRIDGIEAIIRVLESEVMRENIALNYTVKKIRSEDGQWFVSNGLREKSFNKIVSTMPVQSLVEAIDAPKKVKDAANALKYNSLITVMLGIDKNKLNDLSWLYIPDKTVLTHRVSFPSNYSSRVAPSKKSSVLAEITCNLGDSIWKMQDEELIERTVNDLYRLRIINKQNVCFAKVQRTKYAYVISDLDYTTNLSIIKKYFDKRGVRLVGRFAEFKYLNMDACVESALSYVRNRSVA